MQIRARVPWGASVIMATLAVSLISLAVLMPGAVAIAQDEWLQEEWWEEFPVKENTSFYGEDDTGLGGADLDPKFDGSPPLGGPGGGDAIVFPALPPPPASGAPAVVARPQRPHHRG